MSIFDKLKLKNQPSKKKRNSVKKVGAEKQEKTATAEKAEKPKPTASRIEKRQFSDAWRILESAHVTEKAGMLADKGCYIFKVSSRANKPEIKKAVQDLYGAKVNTVRIVNIPRKARKLGRSQGYLPGFKKAMVKLAEGETIEIMPR